MGVIMRFQCRTIQYNYISIFWTNQFNNKYLTIYLVLNWSGPWFCILLRIGMKTFSRTWISFLIIHQNLTPCDIASTNRSASTCFLRTWSIAKFSSIDIFIQTISFYIQAKILYWQKFSEALTTTKSCIWFLFSRIRSINLVYCVVKREENAVSISPLNIHQFLKWVEALILWCIQKRLSQKLDYQKSS